MMHLTATVHPRKRLVFAAWFGIAFMPIKSEGFFPPSWRGRAVCATAVLGVALLTPHHPRLATVEFSPPYLAPTEGGGDGGLAPNKEALHFDLRQVEGNPVQVTIFNESWLDRQVAQKIKLQLEKEHSGLGQLPAWEEPGLRVRIDHAHFRPNPGQPGTVNLVLSGPFVDLKSNESFEPDAVFSGSVFDANFYYERLEPEAGGVALEVHGQLRWDSITQTLRAEKAWGTMRVFNAYLSWQDDFEGGPWLGYTAPLPSIP